MKAVGDSFGGQVGQMEGDDEHVKERSQSCATERGQEATMQMVRRGAEEPAIRLSGGC